MAKISVIINTLNEEKRIKKAMTSVSKIAFDVIVVDMQSDDETQKLAKQLGAKVYEYRRMGYVEPARNYAISKATGDWILILDADETIPPSLAEKLREISIKSTASYYRLPRRNINFGKWMKHSRWWPDYNIRFFKKGSVIWNNEIHSIPLTYGKGADLPAEDQYAIIHENYPTIEAYLERLNRYTTIQSKELISKNHKFIWKDLVKKPLNEFLSRFFAGEGYKDGLHGLAFSLLQAFSELIVYIKVWQNEKFLEQTTTMDEIEEEVKLSVKDIKWWLTEIRIKKGGIEGLINKAYRKIFLQK